MSSHQMIALRFFIFALLLSTAAVAGVDAPSGCEPAPLFSGMTLAGEPLSLETARGGKPWLVLTFFGVRCIPCQKKLAQLNELWRDPQFREKAALYAVNADALSPEKLTEEMKRLKITIDFPVIADGTQAITNLYVDGVVPLTVLIDSEDRIVQSLLGARPEMARKMADRIISSQEARIQ